MKKLIVALLSIFALPSFAGSLPVGTGGETGNYYGMMKDVNDYCGEFISKDLTLDVQTSGGSSDNLNGILNKRYAIGVVQTDVLYYFSRKMPNQVSESTIKAIAGLHDEPLHVLIPRGYQPQSDKGFFGSIFGDDEPVAMSIDALSNQTVGSWGGSIVSAKALSAYMSLNMNVIEVQQGSIPANTPVILVGGTPYKPVESLLATGNWRLVSLDYDEIKSRAPYYHKASLNYSVNGKLQTVPSISVQAILVGKSFRKASRNTPMTELATCITGSIADLADDYSTNPNWGSVYDFVDGGGQTSWSMFDIDEEMLKEFN